MRSILLVLAKYPTPGASKTRLARAIGNQAAAQVQEGMLCDTVARFAKQDGLTIAIVFPKTEPPRTSGRFYGLFASHGIPVNNILTMQAEGDDMNGDIVYAYREALLRTRNVALISADIPHYQVSQLSRLYEVLRSYDVAYHPSRDDGCCPHALRQPADMWTGNNSREPGYINRFNEEAYRQGLTTCALEEVYDVDTLDDLNQLEQEYGYLCPHTFKALAAAAA